MIDEVLRPVAKHYGVSRAQILSKSRAKTVVSARHEAMRIMRILGYSYPEIGKHFMRDHTSVIHAVHKASELPNYALEQRIKATLAATNELAELRLFSNGWVTSHPANNNGRLSNEFFAETYY